MSRDILVDDSDWKCWNIWAWVGECLVRFILTIVFGLSALHIKPIIRYVEGEFDLQKNIVKKQIFFD